MTRHVDDPRYASVVQLQMGESQLEGNAAALFLLQPVGVDSGERFDQGCLAVVDMPRSADDHPSAFGTGEGLERPFMPRLVMGVSAECQ